MRRIAILALAATAFVLPAAADGDAEKGKAAFAKCAACHEIGAGASNKIGPELNGVVGRKPASVEGFSYSSAMTAYGEANPAWTEELLMTYLENPLKVVKGTKMAFAGSKKPEERANVIAYLKSNP